MQNYKQSQRTRCSGETCFIATGSAHKKTKDESFHSINCYQFMQNKYKDHNTEKKKLVTKNAMLNLTENVELIQLELPNKCISQNIYVRDASDFFVNS